MTTMKSQCEIFDNIMDPDDFKQLHSYVASLEINKPSPVFHLASGQNIVDPKVRKSKSTSSDDPSLLELVEKTVLKQFHNKQSTNEKELAVKLARNQVTFIRYDEGGLFDWHIDHEKYRINDGRKWLECHLILGIIAPKDGGELKVRFSETDIKSLDICENRCIVFDKSLEHRSVPVKEGTKLIMTVDVVVSNKDILTTSENSLELQYALNRRVSFISEDISTTKVMLYDLTEIVFNYIRIHEAYGTSVFIYDCSGLYYYQNMDGEEIYYDEPENRLSFSSEDIINNITGCSEIESLIQNDLVNIKNSSHNRIIPAGTRFTKDKGSDYIEFPVIDKLKLRSVQKLSFTYHCNESNYESYNIYQGIGVLYLNSMSIDQPMTMDQINTALEIITSKYDLPEELISFLREQCQKISKYDIRKTIDSAFDMPVNVEDDLMKIIFNTINK